MPTTVEELEAGINEAIQGGFRGRLLDRGEARAMIWQDGQLPVGSPAFVPSLTYELFSYSYALLGMGLRLRESGGNEELARRAFENAAMAFESVLIKGGEGVDGRSFHYVIAAASYHLGRFSARAYSLLAHGQRGTSFSPIEKCLSHLILRNLEGLQAEIVTWRVDGPGTDANITASLEASWSDAADGQPVPESDDGYYVADALGSAIIDNFLAGMGLYIFALERADHAYVEAARERLTTGLQVCAEVNLLPQWWSYRLALHIIDDLWSSTFHERLPLLPNSEDSERWAELRSLYFALLLRRERAEVDLWPSQFDAAAKAVDATQTLVLSLPTSAGKTRIAELCILRCLAANKRVVFVTPLRALSAQTEVALQRTFVPLGKTISTLYGSIGTSAFDEKVLRTRNIVVATPEKLDFALRNDPELLNDVGLVVLDEGHMIGLGEREVRYEAQIQRLLRRPDAANRRIVCLSAILPDGDQLDDFVAWLSNDRPGALVKNDWRPTRLRFGEVTWANNRARLDVHVGNENPFVPNFLGAVVPPRKRRIPFPNDQRELVLATAWRLAADGQSILIYCPERRSVDKYAREIVKQAGYGLLANLLPEDDERLSHALTVGAEWLGPDHPVLACLRMGVAIHHGALPTPFRKELEKLLREGVLKITVSSPTLAQGLNLAATVVIFHSIMTRGEPIKASDFRNIIGRAGRAFVDVEGLVLFPMFAPTKKQRNAWNTLKAGGAGLNMESGLLRLVAHFLARLNKQHGGNSAQLAEYVLNNAQAWQFVPFAGETAEKRQESERDWQRYLATLDTAILSLLGEQEVPDDQVAARLDEVLASSLWERRLGHWQDHMQAVFRNAIKGRARFLWGHSTGPQRRAYFLAGVGYDTGQKLDAIAAEANQFLVQANGHILVGDEPSAITAITALAERLFVITPFVPDPLPANWRDIISAWLSGDALADLASADKDVLRFVENGLVFTLPWGMEAIRVRAEANNDEFANSTHADDYEWSLAVPAVETGSLNRSTALLMQAGFNSRLAAIKAVQDTNATFLTGFELSQWLRSDAIAARSNDPAWPTEASHDLWLTFLASFTPIDRAEWKNWNYTVQAVWEGDQVLPAAGAAVRLVDSADRAQTLILAPDFVKLGRLLHPLNPTRKGLVRANVSQDLASIVMTYQGPTDLVPSQLQ